MIVEEAQKIELRMRIKYILDETHITQAEFSRLFDISDSYMSLIMSGKRPSIGKSLARNISRELRINIDWLMEGKGEKPQIFIIPHITGRFKTDHDLYVGVGILTLADLSNTHDEDIYEAQDYLQFESSIVTIDNKLISKAVRAEGDSMYPSIVDGAIVGVDFDDKVPVDNGIFLIRFPHVGVTIKRLQIRTDGILAVGDNSQVKPELIPVDMLQQGLILGRVRWIHNKV